MWTLTNTVKLYETCFIKNMRQKCWCLRQRRNIVWHPLYVNSKKKKKKDTNELIYITKQKEAHRLRRQTYVAGGKG